MRFPSPFLLLFLSGTAVAGIPLDEHGFVDAVPYLSKGRIVEQLGEPARAIDLTDENGAVYATIWHYHFLNTSDEGDYYKTTELDFIGDRVVNIIFSNSDVEETESVAVSPTSECPATC
jgi:hypothetical protein